MAYACDRKHNSDLKRRYRITRRVYESILKGQNFRCAICQEHQDDVGTLVMEHDNETGILRSACCNSCNLMLGYCKEDVEILAKAIKYLEES